MKTIINKLKLVLLIDDDEGTNFLNNRLIKSSDLVENIVIANNGEDALEYLTSSIDNKHPQPELILLDINMPLMNGWEFMDEYNKLNDEQKAKIVIVMLSTSLNPDDKTRARNIENIDDFRNKPLTTNMFIELVERFFPNCFANN